jgi:hypothetical protein
MPVREIVAAGEELARTPAAERLLESALTAAGSASRVIGKGAEPSGLSLAPSRQAVDIPALRDELVSSLSLAKSQSSRIIDGKLPLGDFRPNDREWREIKKSDGLQNDYARKVRRNESPSLEIAAPALVRRLNLMTSNGEPGAFMTSRGLDRYINRLEIPDSELRSPGASILDVGSGAQQELAKDMRTGGYESTVYSIDPRMKLSINEDLGKLHTSLGEHRDVEGLYVTPKEYRLIGRLFPEARTEAMTAENLKFSDNKFNSVYGLYSVPYYLKDADTIEATLGELNRVLASGGTARLYPVVPAEEDVMASWFKSHKIKPRFIPKPEEFTTTPGLYSNRDPEYAKYKLLTWTKK